MGTSASRFVAVAASIATLAGVGLVAATPAAATNYVNYAPAPTIGGGAQPAIAYANAKMTFVCSVGTQPQDNSVTVQAQIRTDSKGFVTGPGGAGREDVRFEASVADMQPYKGQQFYCEPRGLAMRADNYVIPNIVPYPTPDMSCTSTPSTVFAGDDVAITSTVSNSGKFNTAYNAVTAPGGTPPTSPTSAMQGNTKSLSLPAVTNAKSGTYTCTGFGTNYGATTSSGGGALSSDHTSAAVNATTTVTVNAVPTKPDVPTGTPVFSAMSLDAAKNPVQQFAMTPSKAAPAGWKLAWTGTGTTNGNLPSTVPCGVTSQFTPTLIRDGATNATVVTGDPVDVTPPCVVPALATAKASLSGGSLSVQYAFPANPPVGAQLYAQVATTPDGATTPPTPVGAANPGGGTVTIMSGIPVANIAEVVLTVKLGDRTSTPVTAEAVAEPPRISYPVVTGKEGDPTAPVKPTGDVTLAKNAAYRYAWAGSAPAGLTIDAQTGEISGVANAAFRGSAVVEITNAEPRFPKTQAVVTVDIAPIPPAPATFVYPNIQGQQGVDIGTITPSETAMPTPKFYYSDICSKAPGLTIDPATGAITGTPALPVNGTIHVTATNTGPGGCATPTGLTIHEADIPTFIGSGDIKVRYASTTVEVGTPVTITPITPNPNSRLGLDYTISPSVLPAGLSFDNLTGVISGTPTSPVVAAHYTVTSELVLPGYPTATASGDVTITVKAATPAALPTYPATVSQIGVAQTVTPTIPAGFTGTFSLGGTTPAGMTIDSATGVISWTAAAPTGKRTIDVFVSGAGAPTPLTPFEWTVNPTPGSNLPVPPATGNTGGAGGSSGPNNRPSASEIYPDIVGSAGTTLTVTPNLKNVTAGSVFTVAGGALPAGMTLDTTAGVISGTPERSNGGYGPVKIAITAPDGIRQVADINIAIDDPHHAVNYANRIIGSVGYPLTVYPFTVNTHGTVTYALDSGTLPDGLSLDPKTGIISGTPTKVNQTPEPIVVKATDGYGSVYPSLEIVVNPGHTPWLRYPEYSQIGSGLTTRISPTVTGVTGVTSFSIDGELPDGLTFDTATGVISGSATTASNIIYEPTITALDAAGNPLVSGWATITVIKPGVPMTVTGRPASENLAAGITKVVTKVEYPNWVALSATVDCTGCTWDFNKTTGVLTVKPSINTTWVTATITGSPTKDRDIYVNQTWVRSWEASSHADIHITSCKRTTIDGKRAVRCNGTTTGIPAGTRLQTRLRFAGQDKYINGSQPKVNADGTFTWHRKTNKKVYVYFKGEGTRSQRVITP